MTPLDQAQEYAARRWPVFPCRWQEGPTRKRPLTPHGFHDASRDPETIVKWWSLWPEALIGMPTGRVSGLVVLDIDVKRPEANGFDSLDDLGHSILPDTPMAHTASGGLHVYFAADDRERQCSVGLLGPGLDVRADGGYVILPSPGSGYAFDPLWNFETAAPVAAPGWLWPPKPSRPAVAMPPKPVGGLGPYAEAAIDSACNAIARAPAGEQERSLNAECFSIGTLVGAGILPEGVALQALLRAGAAMPDYDAHHPWRPEEIDLKVRRALSAGVQHPREVRREVA